MRLLFYRLWDAAIIRIFIWSGSTVFDHCQLSQTNDDTRAIMFAKTERDANILARDISDLLDESYNEK